MIVYLGNSIRYRHVTTDQYQEVLYPVSVDTNIYSNTLRYTICKILAYVALMKLFAKQKFIQNLYDLACLFKVIHGQIVKENIQQKVHNDNAGASVITQSQCSLHRVKDWRRGTVYTVLTHTLVSFINLKYLCSRLTPSVVSGDCISQQAWYFHRTAVKQGRVWHFEGG